MKLPILRIERVIKTTDKGTDVWKFLTRLRNGFLIETVGFVGADGILRIVLTTLVGCPVRCVFCNSGGKLLYELSEEELYAQARLVVSRIKGWVREKLTLMGPGDGPFNHNIYPFIRKELDRGNLVSLSTAGIIRPFGRLLRELDTRATLQLSTHYLAPAERAAHMPGTASSPLSTIFTMAEDFAIRSNSKVVLNYVMFDDNCSPVNIQGLCNLIGDRKNLFRVKLSLANPTRCSAGSSATMEDWRNAIAIMRKSEIEFKMVVAKGKEPDERMACGQMIAMAA